MQLFKTRVFASAKMTITGSMVLPYGTSAPTPDTNGGVAVAHVSNVGKVAFQSGGSIYTIAFPSASNGTITVTVASA